MRAGRSRSRSERVRGHRDHHRRRLVRFIGAWGVPPGPRTDRRIAVAARRPRCTPGGARPGPRRYMRHHLRLPDERSRLRAHQGHARVARARRDGRSRTTPTCSSSTPARSGRSPTRSSRPTSATRPPGSARSRICVIAVGGCFAEAQRERIFDLYPFVDVAFGPGSIPHLGQWIESGGFAVPRGRFGTHEHFAAELPPHRERRHQAWVQVSMGCNSVCSYCIVPAVRGREQSRRPGEIVAEVASLARDGVKEITLLGQNVNSWGRDLAPDVVTEFGELLRACDEVDGIERVRFTSPHPKDFREPVIRGDGRVPDGLRARPPAAPVGLGRRCSSACAGPTPRRGTSRSSTSFAPRSPISRSGQTSSSASPARRRTTSSGRSRVVEAVGYDSAFTFVYSPRAGTEAAAMPGQVDEEVKRERMERLVEVVQRNRCGAERGACRWGGGGSRRGRQPDGSLPAPRSHAPQHDGELRRQRRARDAGRRPDHGGDLDDAPRRAGRPRGGLTCASSSPARAARSARTSPSVSSATATRCSGSTSGRTRGSLRSGKTGRRARSSRRSSRISRASTRRSRAASTASSTRTSTSSSIWPPTRRCTNSSVSRTARSRTRS